MQSCKLFYIPPPDHLEALHATWLGLALQWPPHLILPWVLLSLLKNKYPTIKEEGGGYIPPWRRRNGGRKRSRNKSRRLAVGISPVLRKQQSKLRKWGRLQSLKTLPGDSPSPRRPYLLKVPQPSQRMPPAGDRESKHMSPWRPLHLQTTTVARVGGRLVSRLGKIQM